MARDSSDAPSGARPAVQAALDRRRPHAKGLLQLAQRRAQALFDHRVVEGAVEHLLHRVAALRDFGAEQSGTLASRTFAVNGFDFDLSCGCSALSSELRGDKPAYVEQVQ